MTETRLLERSAKPWKPHKFQKKAIRRLLENAAYLLFASPGAGKTSTTLAVFSFLKKRGLARKMLIVAPLRPCYLVWPAEVDKWKDFEHLTYTVLHGNDKEDRLQDDVDLYIINPDGLEWLFGMESYTKPSGKKGVRIDLTRFMELGIDTLVIDELTAFANTTSQRFLMMQMVTQFFQRIWGLTGSPAANGLMKLFGQVKTVDGGRTFGPYISPFRSKYFRQHPFQKFRWDIKTMEKDGFDGEVEIYRALSPIAMRVDAADYIDMPTMIPLKIEVDLPPKARLLYDMVEEDMFALIDAPKKKGGHLPITAANSGVALGKCRQIASGAIYPDEGYDVKGFKPAPSSPVTRNYVVIHDAKLDALSERLDELQGQPYLIGYEFQHDLDRILKRFPKTPFFDSDMKASKRIEDQWNAGELPLLLGHPQSIGHGLNMQESSRNVGWFSLTWNYELYDQFIRRVLRQGNKYQKVFVDHYLTRGTVDELLYRLMESKASTQNRLFDALKDEKRWRSK
jgi:SNF2 family DNA or RNA helicase